MTRLVGPRGLSVLIFVGLVARRQRPAWLPACAGHDTGSSAPNWPGWSRPPGRAANRYVDTGQKSGNVVLTVG